MELSYVGMRQRAVSIFYWVAVSLGIIAILLPWTTDIPAPAAGTLLALAALFTLWIQWQNGRGGFGSIRGLRPTFETRARMSPGQWLVLLLLLIAESAALAFVLVS